MMKSHLSRLVMILAILMIAGMAIAQPSYWIRSYELSIDHADSRTSLEYTYNMVVTQDDGLLLQGGFNSHDTGDPPGSPYLMKINSDFQMEWTRIYNPPGFFNRSIDLLPNGDVMITGRKEQYRFPPFPEPRYTPFFATLDSYGNPRGSVTYPREAYADMPSGIHLSMTSGYALLYWNGNTSLTVLRYDANSQLVWSEAFTVPHLANDGFLFETVGGNVGLVTTIGEDVTLFVLYEATGEDLIQLILDPGYDLNYRDMYATDDGTLFLAVGTHVLKVPPPYESITQDIDTGDIVWHVCGTSDGGFLANNEGWLKKYGVDGNQEWGSPMPFWYQVYHDIVEYAPGVYAGVRTEWTGFDGTDAHLELTMYGIPEPAAPELELYLFQNFEEGFNIPPGGGNFMFVESVTNTWNSAVTVDRWAEVLLPNGNTLSYPATEVTYPVGGEFNTDYTLTVPGNAPAGNYTYMMYLGTYPNDVMTKSSAIFRKFSALEAFTPNPVFDGPEASLEVAGSDQLQEENAAVVTDFALSQAYPNPFNATTTMTVSVPERGRMTMKMYDVLGREVLTILDGPLGVGNHRVAIDANRLASGMYFVQVQTEQGFTATRKVMLVR